MLRKNPCQNVAKALTFMVMIWCWNLQRPVLASPLFGSGYKERYWILSFAQFLLEQSLFLTQHRTFITDWFFKKTYAWRIKVHIICITVSKRSVKFSFSSLFSWQQYFCYFPELPNSVEYKSNCRHCFGKAFKLTTSRTTALLCTHGIIRP